MGSRPVVRALALAAVLTLAGPAAAAVAAVPDEGEPTAEQVQAALQDAAPLRHDAAGQVVTVAQARAALEASAAEAAVALESYARAAAVRDEALREAFRREAAVAQAEQAVEDGRAALARWARQAYVDGGSLGSSPGVYTLLAGGSTDDVATARTWLERAGGGRVQALDRLRAALDAATRVADVARRAGDLAADAAARAAAASAARDAVLAHHRDRAADLQLLLAETRDAAGRAEARAGRLAQAFTTAGPVPAGPVGDCAGEDVSGYGNGFIPESALCPLWQAPGLLRADAAAAFDRMSQAFAGRFGRALCVTDAYRSYAEQVQVRARRGVWAAIPGRSHHGWGTAADLCGGVEDFDSPAYAWLVVNAPLYGWFHPAWARRGGSLPEPWHWEYAGPQ